MLPRSGGDARGAVRYPRTRGLPPSAPHAALSPRLTIGATPHDSCHAQRAADRHPTLPAALRDGVVTRIPTAKRVVALTFAGGAGSQGTANILATLRAHDVPASFFVTGRFVTGQTPTRPVRWQPSARSATTPGATPTSPPSATARSTAS